MPLLSIMCCRNSACSREDREVASCQIRHLIFSSSSQTSSVRTRSKQKQMSLRRRKDVVVTTPPRASSNDAVVATSPRARIVESCRRGAASPRATASPSADDARAPSRIARAARARAANRRRPDMARGCVRRVAATNIATLQREWIVSFRARLV